MRSVRVVATVVLLCATLTACTDAEGGGADDPPQSGEPSVSSDPSRSESAGPEPATGPLIEGVTFSFRLPEGWVDQTPPGDAGFHEGGRPGTQDDSNTIMVQPINAPPTVFQDIRDYSRTAWGTFKGGVTGARRLPLTQWAGKSSYHFAGDGSLVAGYAEEFAVLWKDQALRIWFDFDTRDQPDEWTPAARQAVIESVEASWEWK